jgi:MinD superfamily P-loop ATPase
MKQLAVLSGKGGTGKTSFTAVLARLASRVVVADADVDAPNLHLLLRAVGERGDAREFPGRFEMVPDPEACNGCGECERLCRFGAIALEPCDDGIARPRIDELACEGCGLCSHACPAGAIGTRRRVAGTIRVLDTEVGPLIHARLRVAEENSGKLVSEVRRLAVEVAREEERGLVLVDGPPGVGCPAIAALTGADAALLVTEPTPAGLHDLGRAARLAAHFRIPAAVVLNKADLYPPAERELRAYCDEVGLAYLGSVPYSPAFHAAARAGRTVAEMGEPMVAGRMLRLHEDVSGFLAEACTSRVA